MATLPETPSWESGIHQLEEADRAKAGAGGVLNVQATQLANRTRYLRAAIQSVPDYREYTFYVSPTDPDGTIAGIAATSPGQAFRVAQGSDDDNSFLYYKNNSGVPLLVARAIGTAAIDRMLPQYQQLNNLVALFVDTDGNVPVFLNEGLLDAFGLSSNLVEYIFNNSELFSEVRLFK
ncbi:hypothetical protein [Phytobacter sp. V91]|uniref:hypothetical protein n=1 Tax=Phytobacter sp. V91 TaxID=3369425 RepID=UPI003F5E388C